MTARKDWRKTTLAERLHHTLELAVARWPPARRRGPRDKRLQGVVALAAAMGVDPGSVTSLVKRESERTADSRDTGPSANTFRKYADAVPVSYLWLTLGEGQPDDINPWTDGYCRELEVAIEFMGGVDAVGVKWARLARAAAASSSHEATTPEEWADWIEAQRSGRPKRAAASAQSEARPRSFGRGAPRGPARR